MTRDDELRRLVDPMSGSSSALREVLASADDPADADRLARVGVALGAVLGTAAAAGTLTVASTAAAAPPAALGAGGATTGGASAGAGVGLGIGKATLWLVAGVTAAAIGGGVVAWRASMDGAPARAPGAAATKPGPGTPSSTAPEPEAPAVVQPDERGPGIADPASASAPSATRRAGPPRSDALRAELELLEPAQRLVATAPTEALRLVEVHARRFPSGALAEEREVYAIDALTRLGRTRQATKRAERFLRTYPASTHAVRVREMLDR